MRSVEFVAYAEKIHGSELAARAHLEAARMAESAAEGRLSAANSRLAAAEAALAAAQPIVHYDSEGYATYDYSPVYEAEARVSAAQSEVSAAQSALDSARSKRYAAEAALDAVLAEKASAIAEIQQRAAQTSQNISYAGMMTGDFARVGNHLQDSFHQSLSALSRAAGILGSYVSGGGTGSSGSGRSHSGGGASAGGSKRGGSSFTGGVHAMFGGGAGSGRKARFATAGSSGMRSPIRPMQRSSSVSGSSKPVASAFRSASKSGVGGNAVFLKKNASAVHAPKVSASSAGFQSSRQSAGISKRLNGHAAPAPPVPTISLKKKYDPNSRFRQGADRYYTDDNGTPFRMNDALLANAKYTLRGYTYRTDAVGRISCAEGKLRLREQKRSALNTPMTDASKTHHRSSDQRGHLIADLFDAAAGLGNLVPMDCQLNQSRYRSLEARLAKALEAGKDVYYRIQPVYHGRSFRPTGFLVDYTIDGKKESTTFVNHALRRS